jgi:LmbE family N-acetylglucosaminyl deacetylase
MSKQTLLAILAHPDDESFGMGGTLALYASRGVDVHLVCATRGEVGEVADLKGHATIAELREGELRCAAGILGLAGVHFLDYRDSGMAGSPENRHPNALAAQPLEQVAVKVADCIRKLHPQVVLTFDPIGGYRHPDHIAIHNATVRAFELAQGWESDAPQRLYFHTMPHAFLKVAVWLFRLIGKDPRKFGANRDIDLAAIAAVSFPIHARINIRPMLEKKEAAGACHASQGGGRFGGRLAAPLLRLFNGAENYMRAFPPVVAQERIEDDLFVCVV